MKNYLFFTVSFICLIKFRKQTKTYDYSSDDSDSLYSSPILDQIDLSSITYNFQVETEDSQSNLSYSVLDKFLEMKITIEPSVNLFTGNSVWLHQ